MSNEIATWAEVGEVGWYVPAGAHWCPRCGDQNWDDNRLCLTCTYGDSGYRDGLYANGWHAGSRGWMPW